MSGRENLRARKLVLCHQVSHVVLVLQVDDVDQDHQLDPAHTIDDEGASLGSRASGLFPNAARSCSYMFLLIGQVGREGKSCERESWSMNFGSTSCY